MEEIEIKVLNEQEDLFDELFLKFSGRRRGLAEEGECGNGFLFFY